MAIEPLIALSGASSFTGIWIAKTLSELGFAVQGLLTSADNDYVALKKKRIEFLRQYAQLCENIRADDGSMEKWIRFHRPAVWIHHHHFMEHFRSDAYDLARAERINIAPLESVVKALSDVGARGVIYSGTYLEEQPGPYARSKQQTWLALRELTEKHQLRCSKIIIPNPIGAFENTDRLIPQLIDKAREGLSLKVTQPLAIHDYIDVTQLAIVYGRAAQLILEGSGKVFKPSGWVATTRDLIEVVNRELIEKELGLVPSTVIVKEGGSSPAPPIDWSKLWQSYASLIRKWSL